jgi:hypothetical protein
MLFSDRLSARDIVKAKNSGRQALLESILSDFRAAFPDITFELRLDFSSINALAMKLRELCKVTVYGGLALHPKLGADAFAFVLLHETGHHLADGCRLVRDPSLACECAADYWALTKGSEQLKTCSGQCFDVETALSELSVVMNTGQKARAKYSQKKVVCWAKSWDLRRRALLERKRAPAANGSCVTYF